MMFLVSSLISLIVASKSNIIHLDTRTLSSTLTQCDIMPLDYIKLDSTSNVLQINKNIDISHYFIEIVFDFLLLGHWQQDTIKIYGDSTYLSEFKYSSSSFNLGSFCKDGTQNYVISEKVQLYHTNSKLNLTFSLQQNDNPKTNPLVLGIRNIYLNISQCHYTCGTCSGPTQFECRTCPIYAIKTKRTSQCKCPQNKQFIYNGECVGICPRYTIDCQYSELIIKNAESIFDQYNTENWAINIIDEHKMFYDNVPMLGMFKEIERVQLQFVSLAAHQEIQIRFKLYFFNIWAVGEFLKITIDQMQQKPIIKTLTGFSNSFQQQDCISKDIELCVSLYANYVISHTKDSVDIEIFSDTYPKSLGRWAIREFSVDLIRCSPKCLSCKDVNYCEKCDEHYFNYQGMCVSVCPSPSILVESLQKCVNPDEFTTSKFLEYSFVQQRTIITNSSQYCQLINNGTSLNGLRLLGGYASKNNNYIQRLYNSIEPHYAIRLLLQITLFNLQNQQNIIAIRIDKKPYVQLQNDPTKQIEYYQINQSIPHNTSTLNFQILPLLTTLSRYGMSDFMIVIEQCYPTCQICSGPKQSDCTLWEYEPSIIDLSKLKCEDETYFNKNSQKCELCQDHCQSCDTFTKCTKCKQGYQLSGFTCYCANGYYEDANQQCLKCSDSCTQCVGPLESDCLDLQTSKGNCYDGIWTPGEQCDDGNYVLRDGCSECLIDEGYSCVNEPNKASVCFRCQMHCSQCQTPMTCVECNSGYYYDQIKSQCLKCADGCLKCKSKDFCFECSVLGWTPLEGVCTSCASKPGYYLVGVDCVPQCGDGIVAANSSEQCDDGNTNNLDGCDSDCKIEQSFQCSDATCIQIDPYAQLQYIDKKSNNQFILELQNVQSECQYVSATIEGFSSEEFDLEVSDLYPDKGMLCKLIFTYYKDINPTNFIYVKVKTLNNQRRALSEDIVITLSVQPRMKELYYRYLCQNQQLYSPSQQESTDKSVNAYKIFTKVVICIGILAIIFGRIQFYFNALELIMWISYLNYLNITYPLNISKIYQYRPFQFLVYPFPYENNIQYTDILQLSEIQDFLNNMWQCIAIYSYFIVITIIAYSIMRKLTKNQLPMKKKASIQHCLTFNNKDSAKIYPDQDNQQQQQQQQQQQYQQQNQLKLNNINQEKLDDKDPLSPNIQTPNQEQIKTSQQISMIQLDNKNYIKKYIFVKKTLHQIGLFLVYLFYLDLSFSSLFDLIYVRKGNYTQQIIYHVFAALTLTFTLILIRLLRFLSNIHPSLQKKHKYYKVLSYILFDNISIDYYLYGCTRKLLFILLLFSSQSIYQILAIVLMYVAIVLIYQLKHKPSIYLLSYYLIDFCIISQLCCSFLLAADQEFDLLKTSGKLIIGQVMFSIIYGALGVQLLLMLPLKFLKKS